MHMSVFRLFFIFSDGKQSLGIQGIFINYPLLFVSSWRRFCCCCCCNSYGISYDASKTHLSPGPFISMPQSCCMPLPQIIQIKTSKTPFPLSFQHLFIHPNDTGSFNMAFSIFFLSSQLHVQNVHCN